MKNYQKNKKKNKIKNKNDKIETAYFKHGKPENTHKDIFSAKFKGFFVT